MTDAEIPTGDALVHACSNLMSDVERRCLDEGRPIRSAAVFAEAIGKCSRPMLQAIVAERKVGEEWRRAAAERLGAVLLEDDGAAA
jgi:hypothetical protein